jgi:hypothetical protein
MKVVFDTSILVLSLNPNAKPPSTPEPKLPAHGDFSPFVWQKLNDLDGRFAEFCEKYGRVEATIEANNRAIDKLDARLDSFVEKLDAKIEARLQSIGR